MQSMAIEVWLEVMKRCNYLTPLDCDIISTQDVLYSRPFDIDAAARKVQENRIKYPELFLTQSQINSWPYPWLCQQDVITTLRRQLDALKCKKLSAAIQGRRI